MPPCLTHITPYKGLFILVVVFVALEYLLNTVSDTKNAIFNSSSSSAYLQKSSINYGPLLKTLMFKNHVQNITNIPSVNHKHQIIPKPSPKNNFSINLSNLNYVITIPPFLLENVTSTYGVANLFEVTTSADSWENINNGSIKLEESSYDGTASPLCPDISQQLYGRVLILKYPVPSVQSLERRFSWLNPGGHWAPSNCKVKNKVAIVIPFRCRGEHLLLFLQHMHPFLKKQQLDYTIFVVEQDGEGPFNRAMLMNIGYVEALKLKDYDCFIFHDVDLLPEDDRNLYTCPQQPRHMSVAVDMFKYNVKLTDKNYKKEAVRHLEKYSMEMKAYDTASKELPYPAIFGGVSAISTNHFKILNGFSNSFSGWGGEDDDMSNRIRYHHLYISRYPITIARYTMLTHKKDKPNPNRYDLLRKGQKMFDKDGLNNLSYELIQKKENLLYTWLLVKINPLHGS